MAATIEQIAQAAQVSRGTVDRVLHNRGRVSPEVAERIWSIAGELGYKPKPRNRAQKPAAATCKIGVITQLARASFMDEIHRGLRIAETELASRGVEVILQESQMIDEIQQLKAIDELLEAGVAGIAVMPIDSAPVRAKLKEVAETRKIPVVTFNSDVVGVERVCFVGLDNWKSGALAAGLMSMLTGGSGKILIITGFFSNIANNMRVDGFLSEVKQSFPGLEIVGVQGSFDDSGEVMKITCSALEAHPDLAGILVISGGQEGVAAAFAQAARQQRPRVIVYDLLEHNRRMLLDNTVDILIDQEGFLQGYRALQILADLLLRGVRPEEEFQYTNISVRTKYNI